MNVVMKSRKASGNGGKKQLNIGNKQMKKPRVESPLWVKCESITEIIHELSVLRRRWRANNNIGKNFSPA